METNDETQDPLVEDQEAAAAADAAAIGGEGGSDNPDPEMQPVEEAGGGVAEGFEQAEDDLIENASHGDGAGNPEADAIDNENVEADRSTAAYGEPDEIDATEVTSDPDEPDGPGEGTPIAPDR
jgi:hypothetical protein